ncbi:hypothetical protein WA026_022710 [Henosepilachna vigintioctopunctata]|uniref:CWH43-like N-terminal domain-containing protein n=1 Tax=Henosepilachna vigintioctopunctata TaxID=420089 RepID=A0AAW1TPN8_9CUCU
MSFELVHYLPILISVWFPITFLITYTIAVCDNHVSPLFPFISDTGTFSPESCIFGQMLNLGAMMMAACCYLRYLQIQDLYENNSFPDSLRKHNKLSFILGLSSSIGISIVGNFQEKNALAVHFIGAFLAFGVGWVYFTIQTHMAFKIYPHLGTKGMNWFRLILSVGVIIFFILIFVFGTVAYLNGAPAEILQKLDPGDPGWLWHFMCTLSEWILTLCEILFLASFTHDFKRISFTGPSISYKLK